MGYVTDAVAKATSEAAKNKTEVTPTATDSSKWDVAQPTVTPEVTPKPDEPEVVNKVSLQDNIQKSLQNPNQKANTAFIQGVAKLANQAPATAEELAMEGMTLTEVVNKFGVGDKFEGFAMAEPIEEEAVEEPKSSLDKLTSMADNYMANVKGVRAEAKEEEGVSVIETKMTEAQATADNILTGLEQDKTDLEATDIINEEAKIALKAKISGQVIPMSDINAQLFKGMEDLNQAQRMKRLYDVYEINSQVNLYNAQIRNVQLIQGQYDRAMDNVQQNVEDWKVMQDLKLQVLEEQGQIEKEEKARYEQEIEYERSQGEKGYVHVESIETYNQIVKDLGVTADTYSNFFYKDPGTGKIYLKPSDAKKTSGANTAITGGGILKADAKIIETNLLAEIGGDGFLNPDDYNLGKQDWVQAGGEPDEFDKKFAGRRNPDNAYYEVTGKISPLNEDKIRELKNGDYTADEIIDAGYDEETVKKIFDEDKGDNKWYQFWK